MSDVVTLPPRDPAAEPPRPCPEDGRDLHASWVEFARALDARADAIYDRASSDAEWLALAGSPGQRRLRDAAWRHHELILETPAHTPDGLQAQVLHLAELLEDGHFDVDEAVARSVRTIADAIGRMVERFDATPG